MLLCGLKLSLSEVHFRLSFSHYWHRGSYCFSCQTKPSMLLSRCCQLGTTYPNSTSPGATSIYKNLLVGHTFVLSVCLTPHRARLLLLLLLLLVIYCSCFFFSVCLWLHLTPLLPPLPLSTLWSTKVSAWTRMICSTGSSQRSSQGIR